MERRRTYTIGIAGRSCSGKTSISRRLAAMLPGEVTIYGLDHYYLDLSHLSYEERAQMNFDHPDSLESALLVEHVAALKRGEEIRHPVYDFSTHTRIAGKYENVMAGDYLIVEGLFTFYWPELRELFDSRFFIATVDPICFGRRKQRDVAERGRSPESIIAQYSQTVR